MPQEVKIALKYIWSYCNPIVLYVTYVLFWALIALLFIIEGQSMRQKEETEEVFQSIETDGHMSWPKMPEIPKGVNGLNAS